MPRTPKPTKPMKGVELKVMTYEGKRPKCQDVLIQAAPALTPIQRETEALHRYDDPGASRAERHAALKDALDARIEINEGEEAAPASGTEHVPGVGYFCSECRRVIPNHLPDCPVSSAQRELSKQLDAAPATPDTPAPPTLRGILLWCGAANPDDEFLQKGLARMIERYKSASPAETHTKEK